MKPALSWLEPRRVVLAFLLAPLAPSALAALITVLNGPANGGYFRWLMIFALGAYPPTAVLGLPVFLILSPRLKPRLIYAMLAGGVVAAAPWLLAVLLGPKADFAAIDGSVTVRDGVMTPAGWVESLRMIGTIFAAGLVGGLVFWLVAVFRWPSLGLRRDLPTGPP